MLAVYVHVHAAIFALASSLRLSRRPVHGVPAPSRRADERGQTTAEYALVLLGAAAVALLVVAWATDTDLIGKLFDAVVDAVTGKVK